MYKSYKIGWFSRRLFSQNSNYDDKNRSSLICRDKQPTHLRAVFFLPECTRKDFAFFPPPGKKNYRFCREKERGTRENDCTLARYSERQLGGGGGGGREGPSAMHFCSSESLAFSRNCIFTFLLTLVIMKKVGRGIPAKGVGGGLRGKLDPEQAQSRSPRKPKSISRSIIIISSLLNSTVSLLPMKSASGNWRIECYLPTFAFEGRA